MFDSAELRVHPTGKAILKLGVKSQGQGHETTFAQIVAEELGIPSSDIKVMEGDTDNTPYGLGTYASRSTPYAGAATAMIVARAARQGEEARRAPARMCGGRHRMRARALLRQGRARPVEDHPGRRIRRLHELPESMEAGLEGVHYYDPPNMTYPFGSYVVVVEVDRGTGQWKVRARSSRSTTAACASTR